MSTYTKKNLASDVDDVAEQHGMTDILEGHFATNALACEQTGISHQIIKPGKRVPFGHTHSRQEELYVVIGGSGRMKVGEELVELGGRLDAVRVAPDVWRGIEAGPDGLELLAFGGPTAGESDADVDPTWWPAD